MQPSLHQIFLEKVGATGVEEAVERYTDGVPVSEHYLAVRDAR